MSNENEVKADEEKAQAITIPIPPVASQVFGFFSSINEKVKSAAESQLANIPIPGLSKPTEAEQTAEDEALLKELEELRRAEQELEESENKLLETEEEWVEIEEKMKEELAEEKAVKIDLVATVEEEEWWPEVKDEKGTMILATVIILFMIIYSAVLFSSPTWIPMVGLFKEEEKGNKGK